MKRIVLTVCLAVFMAVPAAQAQDNYINGPSAQAVLQYTDTGWYDWSVTSDCADGWGDDQWEFTNSAFGFLTVTVEDCCIVGDYYEIWVDGALIGTTPNPGYPGTTLSVGSATIWLAPGTHSIEIRDALFDFLTTEQLAIMCPAGYSVGGEWEPVIEFTKEITDEYDGGDGDGVVEVGEDWHWLLTATLTNVSGETIHIDKVHDRLAGDLELIDIWAIDPEFGTPEVYTKGKTEKIFIDMYDGFDLADGDSVSFTLWVSTDLNTGTGNGKKDAKQEYTSAGEHCLNSGAWFGGYIGDTYIEGSSNSVCVEVFEAD